MSLSLPFVWAFPFRANTPRRRNRPFKRPSVAAESVETRCLLSATSALSEIAFDPTLNDAYLVDPACNSGTSCNEFDPVFHTFDLTYNLADEPWDVFASVDNAATWDSSQSSMNDCFWVDFSYEIMDSFQSAIEGNFTGYVDSLWYEDSQTIEYIGDVIYLTLEAPSGEIVPVQLVVVGSDADTVLTSGSGIFQEVESLLVAPETGVFDANNNLQIIDITVNVFLDINGTSDQLIVDSFEVLREDPLDPGFLESEFVIVDDFGQSFDFMTDALPVDTFGGEETLALADLPVIETDGVATDEAGLESGDAFADATDPDESGLDADFESSTVSDSIAVSPELQADSDVESTVERRPADVSEDSSRLTPTQNREFSLHETQDISKTPRSKSSADTQGSIVQRERQPATSEKTTSRQVDRWQRLRHQAAIAASEIAASGSASYSTFRHTGVVPATTGSIATTWATTIAAFAHSAFEDQLQGLVNADTDSDTGKSQPLTYAQVTSATGTLLIGGTALFQTLRKRRNDKLNRRWRATNPPVSQGARTNYNTANAKAPAVISCAVE